MSIGIETSKFLRSLIKPAQRVGGGNMSTILEDDRNAANELTTMSSAIKSS